MAALGAERFRQETGVAYLSADASDKGDQATVLRGLAGQGATIIVAVGVTYADAVREVAAAYPAIQFTIIDAIVSGANIQSVTMREQEGSYLVGILAALASKTGKIGFVGGLDIPLIRKFAAGYKLGAQRVDQHIEVIESTIGGDQTAWRQPERAEQLANAQFARGVDVIYAAAGASGIGVYQAAKAKGKLAIGVDTNQNGLFPGTMLTSMVKHIDTVVYKAFKSANDGSWSAGEYNLGLANGAVGWALDENNRALISPAMQARVTHVADDIIAGRIQVSDYTER